MPDTEQVTGVARQEYKSKEEQELDCDKPPDREPFYLLKYMVKIALMLSAVDQDEDCEMDDDGVFDPDDQLEMYFTRKLVPP
jgi:hypothetical protein